MPGNNLPPEAIEAAAEAMKQRRRNEIEQGAPRATYEEMAMLALEAAFADHVVGWRTMDSAPKDGTHFLAIYGDDDDGTYWILFCNGTFFECVSAGYQVEHATHWQPLPAAPSPVKER